MTAQTGRRKLTEAQELRGMSSAPKDGTHILAYLYQAPDSEGYRGFGEWREIWWKPHVSFGMNMPWHAGDPFDSHGGIADTHYGEGVPRFWLPLPQTPSRAALTESGRTALAEGGGVMSAVVHLPTAVNCPVCGKLPDIDRVEPWPKGYGPAPWYAACYGYEPIEHHVGANGDTQRQVIEEWNRAATPQAARSRP